MLIASQKNDFKKLLESYIKEEEKSITITQGRNQILKNRIGKKITHYKLTSLLQFGRILDKETLMTYAYGERSKRKDNK